MLATQLAARAETLGINLGAGTRFGLSGAFDRYLRIPFSLAPAELEQALLRIKPLWLALNKNMVEWAQAAIDEVRTEAWQRARANTYESKKGRGRPKKGEEKDRTADQIKNTKFALGKAPENLTARQEAQLQFIAKTDKKLYKAYQLKEYLRTLIHIPLEELEGSLKDWLWKASHSQIKPIYELQKKIRRHYEAIINTARYHLSNARIESTNNKIKLTVRMAYGFRNIDNLLDMIMLRCSDISVQLPYQRLISTHTS